MKALILMNMGGAESKQDLKMFLTNMFNDKYILTIKFKFLRSMIASFIVKSRLNSAWEHYEEIGGKSPINDITKSLVAKVQNLLPDTKVVWLMRYTHPRVEEIVNDLKKSGVKEVVLMPLYPQFSTTTSLSSLEDFTNFAKSSFETKKIKPFYKSDEYNEICAKLISETLADDSAGEFDLIFSAHGLPQKVVDAGDPYQKQIEKHAKLITQKLKRNGLVFKSTNLAYQSKVGPLKWLEPSLEQCLENFKSKKVIIFPIAFTIDNSETVFELSVEYKEIADKLSIADYRVCKCPNDSDDFAHFIKNVYLHTRKI